MSFLEVEEPDPVAQCLSIVDIFRHQNLRWYHAATVTNRFTLREMSYLLLCMVPNLNDIMLRFTEIRSGITHRFCRAATYCIINSRNLGTPPSVLFFSFDPKVRNSSATTETLNMHLATVARSFQSIPTLQVNRKESKSLDLYV